MGREWNFGSFWKMILEGGWPRYHLLVFLFLANFVWHCYTGRS